MIVYPKNDVRKFELSQKDLIFSQELMLELTKTGLLLEKNHTKWFKVTHAKNSFAESI